MKTKPKKLTPRARKKEATMINNNARKRDIAELDRDLSKLKALHRSLSAYCQAVNYDLEGLFARVERLEKGR